MMTSCHSRSMTNKFHEEFPEIWDGFIKFEIRNFGEFQDHWLNIAKNEEIPIHFIRFEDMLQNKKKSF